MEENHDIVADVCGAHLLPFLYARALRGYKIFSVQRYTGQEDRKPKCEFCGAETEWIVLAEG